MSTCMDCGHECANCKKRALNPTEKRYVVERRIDGYLVFEGEQPPLSYFTKDALAKLYYERNPEMETASWETIEAWYHSKDWYWREKTW